MHKKATAGAGESAWIDPEGYKAAVEERQSAFEKELKRQEMAEGTGKLK